MANVESPLQGYGTLTEGRINIPIGLLAAGGTPPVPVTVAPYRGYAYTVGDSSYFQFPLPIDFMQETNPSTTPADTGIFIRWGCNETYAANTGAVRWQIAWETCDQNGESLGAGRAGRTQTGDINIPTLARQVQQTRVGDLMDQYIEVGDTIGVTISRIATESGVTPVQEPEIYGVWVSYFRLWQWGSTAR